MKILSSAVIILITLMLFSCTNTAKPYVNYAELYQQSGGDFNPQYIVYHVSKNQTELHYRFKSKELLYVRKDKTQPYFSRIKLTYSVLNPENFKDILDSNSVIISDTSVLRNDRFLSGKIDINMNMGVNSVLKLKCEDLNRNTEVLKYINVNKTNSNSAQFFLLKKDDKVLYQNYDTGYFEGGLYSHINKGAKITANYYIRDFGLAPPPFASGDKKPFKYKADLKKQYTINDEGFASVTLGDSGFVHFLLDTTQRTGFSFYTFNHNFPHIQTYYGMIDPLRYISSKSEFELLNKEGEIKEQLDKFWLKKAGSKERAREVIRKYYRRVESANLLFSSYQEGWKTDRGMIAVIFGLPRSVRKVRDEEIWVYGEENNVMALSFTFRKVENPFTDEDYRLSRSPTYKTNWYRAVDAWRSGRVYWVR